MINYETISRKNPNDPTKSAFYPVAVIKGFIDLDTLCNEVSAECTVTEHDVKGVLSALQSHILTNLQNGNSVRLGDIGSFHIRVNSKKNGKATAADVTIDDVKSIRVHFNKSSKMLYAFSLKNNKIKFQVIKKA